MILYPIYVKIEVVAIPTQSNFHEYSFAVSEIQVTAPPTTMAVNISHFADKHIKTLYIP